MMRPNGVVLYLALVFASGAAVGGFGHWLYTTQSVDAEEPRSSADYRRDYMAVLQTRLNLTPDQARQLSQILDETRANFHRVFAKHRPEFDAITKEKADKIRVLLNDDQQIEFEKIEHERERRKHEHRHKPDGC